MKIRSSTLTSVDVLSLIQEARDAELCRNLDLSREILSAVWEDIEVEPDLASFPFPEQAELLRLCGVFLNQFGRARGLPDHQIRAKDILTRAARLFDEGNISDKAAETKVALANCYLFAGEITEYDDILKTVKAEFEGASHHPVSIQIDLNQLLAAMLQKNFDQAESFIEKITRVISREHDFRLQTQFHNLAGITYRRMGDVDKSFRHAMESVEIARAANNSMFVAFNLNNLAIIYLTRGESERALATSNEAIAITTARGDKGWTAHLLDTKALIYLDQCEYNESLKVIESALEIFVEGEDYGGLTDAMWTKCLCLLRLDRFTDALRVYIELRDLAARQIGQIAVDKFEKLLAEEVYVLKHFPLIDELAVLKRSLVVKAMRESGGHISKAALKLGLRSQQHLSDMLNNHFPDVYEELGIKRRARRTNRAKQKPPAPGLTRLMMPEDRTFSFNFAWCGEEELQFFYFPRNLMREFGVMTDAVVAVIPVESESLMEGDVVLYFKDDIFRTGRLSYDEFTELFLVDLEGLIFLPDVELIGVPLGYCPMSEQNKRTMRFERL